jgi:hypothetical protein
MRNPQLFIIICQKLENPLASSSERGMIPAGFSDMPKSIAIASMIVLQDIVN